MRKKVIIAIIWVTTILISFFIGQKSVVFLNVKSEYATAEVIRKTTKYVEQNRNWPKSWSDLALDNRKTSELVTMNFDLDINSCTHFDVSKSIKPQNGKFFTYPHAEDDLNDLYKIIKKNLR